MTTGNTLELARFLPYRLARIAEIVSREFARVYRERHGMTRPEWRAPAALGEFGAMTATQIGAHSSMHKTKVSRAVAALEKRRWLARESDEKDRRVERLTLTRAGEITYNELAPLALAFEARLLETIGESAENLLAGLSALEANFVDQPDEDANE